MKAITIRQPWASLIIENYKHYEFRSWKTNYRGKVYIHAGSSIDKDILNRFDKLNIDYPLGAIIGEATLTDCVLVDEEFNKELHYINPLVYFNTSYKSKYAFKFENIVKYENPIPCKGHLSLWNTELLEVYTKDYKKTGEIIIRGDIPKTGYILSAGVIIENSNGEYLIQKTSKEKGNEFANTSGLVMSKESPITCIKREVKEELGLDINIDELKFLGCDYHPDYPLIFNFYLLKMDVNINELNLQEEEVSYVTWMSKDEIIKKIDNGEFRKVTANTLEKFIL